MDRWQRNLLQMKQRKASVKEGIPSVTDLEEGTAVYRTTSEGLVQFIRVNNILYKSVFIRALDFSGVADDSPAEDGFIQFENGIITQWGKETSGSTSITVTFPIKFPNECFNVICTDYDDGETGGLPNASAVHTLPTHTQVVINCYNTGDSFFWQAIGN